MKRNAYCHLERLCTIAEKAGMQDVSDAYAVIIEHLRRLDLVINVLLATDTTKDMTDKKIIEYLNQVVFEDTKLLHAIELI